MKPYAYDRRDEHGSIQLHKGVSTPRVRADEKLIPLYSAEQLAELLDQVRLLTEQRDALVAESVALKSNLMFWDAEDPEAPYEHPDEIASECEMDVDDIFDVQVAARMPNRKYRVVTMTDDECRTEQVGSNEIQTPATDAAIAALRAEGVEMFAAEMSAQHQKLQSGGYFDRQVVIYAKFYELASSFARQLRESKGAQG
ncbi:hypothetical protein KXR87_09040 [Yokenella regensburgei]|uniref:hypothetical protein n=1 Tax=Yokenella regensburgei TaxID=158877 RepID=UPI003F18BE07